MKQTKRKNRFIGILKGILKKRHRDEFHYTGKTQFKSRRMARSIAKAKMERAGVEHINTRFSSNWREFFVAR